MIFNFCIFIIYKYIFFRTTLLRVSQSSIRCVWPSLVLCTQHLCKPCWSNQCTTRRTTLRGLQISANLSAATGPMLRTQLCTVSTYCATVSCKPYFTTWITRSVRALRRRPPGRPSSRVCTRGTRWLSRWRTVRKKSRILCFLSSYRSYQ